MHLPPQQPDTNWLMELGNWLFPPDDMRSHRYARNPTDPARRDGPGRFNGFLNRGGYPPATAAVNANQRADDRAANRTHAGTFQYRPPMEYPEEPAPAVTMPLPGHKPTPPSVPIPEHKPAENITVAEALNRAMRAGAPVQPGMTPGDFEALARAHGFTGVYR